MLYVRKSQSQGLIAAIPCSSYHVLASKQTASPYNYIVSKAAQQCETQLNRISQLYQSRRKTKITLEIIRLIKIFSKIYLDIDEAVKVFHSLALLNYESATVCVLFDRGFITRKKGKYLVVHNINPHKSRIKIKFMTMLSELGVTRSGSIMYDRDLAVNASVNYVDTLSVRCRPIIKKLIDTENLILFQHPISVMMEHHFDHNCLYLSIAANNKCAAKDNQTLLKEANNNRNIAQDPIFIVARTMITCDSIIVTPSANQVYTMTRMTQDLEKIMFKFSSGCQLNTSRVSMNITNIAGDASLLVWPHISQHQFVLSPYNVYDKEHNFRLRSSLIITVLPQFIHSACEFNVSFSTPQLLFNFKKIKIRTHHLPNRLLEKAVYYRNRQHIFSSVHLPLRNVSWLEAQKVCADQGNNSSLFTYRSLDELQYLMNAFIWNHWPGTPAVIYTGFIKPTKVSTGVTDPEHQPSYIQDSLNLQR